MLHHAVQEKTGQDLASTADFCSTTVGRDAKAAKVRECVVSAPVSDITRFLEESHMARTRAKTRPRHIVANPEDLIRIVPLHLPAQLLQRPAGLAPPAPPQLTFRGGPLLSAVRVFTIYWGDAWQQSPQQDLVNQLNAFFAFILTSPLIDQLAEYSVPNTAIGHGSFLGSATVTDQNPPSSVSDAAIQHFLQGQILNNPALPQPDSNTLYFLYLPPGVAVVQGGGRSCQAFCGYHDNVNGQIFYAVMPYPGCSGCTSNLSVFEALTSTSSHELCEAITDPIPGQGWYDDVNGEIGDICAWQTKQVGDYTVQLEWSNQANACV
jgi:hypothetical protein